jgi:hypothetical protein
MKLAKSIGYWFSAILARVAGLFRSAGRRSPATPSTTTSAPHSTPERLSPLAALAHATSRANSDVVWVGGRDYWRSPAGPWYRVVARDAGGLWVGRRRVRRAY